MTDFEFKVLNELRAIRQLLEELAERQPKFDHGVLIWKPNADIEDTPDGKRIRESI